MNPFARMPKPDSGSARAYAGAQYNRTTNDWVATGASQDSETLMALRPLRYRSRQLVRDYPYAKNALRVIRNNVVGQGIMLQPEITMLRGGKKDTNKNAAIKKAFRKWAKKKNCDVAGKLSFADMQRQIINSLVQDGEVLVRKHKQPFGKSDIPYALEMIESDRLIDFRNARADNGNMIRMGVEQDNFHRPIAYWLWPYHPGDYQFQAFTPSKFIRVPADEIMHLFIGERIDQSRGIPWLHAGMTKARHLSGYDEAEVIAARISACIMGFIESPEGDYQEEPEVDGKKQKPERNMNLEPGVSKVLSPGEKFTAMNPVRPGGQYEPFMRAGIRSIGAAVGTSYESLSKDYSQSNYSSSRLALLDDRDNWRVIQQWLIENFCEEVYCDWLPLAVLAGEVDIPSFFTNEEFYLEAEWKPRGWSWVDPFKEVQAYEIAIRSGMMTQADVLAQDGGDIDDYLDARANEVKKAKDLGLVFDSNSAQTDKRGQIQLQPAPDETAATEDDKTDESDNAQTNASGDKETEVEGGVTDDPSGAINES